MGTRAGRRSRIARRIGAMGVAVPCGLGAALISLTPAAERFERDLGLSPLY